MKTIKQIYIKTLVLGLAFAGVFAITTPALQAGALECSVLPNEICSSADYKGDNVSNTGIWKLLVLVINIMTTGVALTAVGGIVYGSILYTSAAGNPEQVKKAKMMLLNVAIGVLAFALMYSLLQWLIPGGVFNNAP